MEYRQEFYAHLSKSSRFKYSVYSDESKLNIDNNNCSLEVILGSNLQSVIRDRLYFWKKLPFIELIQRYDVIIIPTNMRIANLILLLALARFSRTKVIGWGHRRSSHSTNYRSAVGDFFRHFFDYLIFYFSHETLGEFDYKKGYLENTVNTDAIKFEIKNRLVVKDRNSVKNTLKVIFLGRLNEKSNVSLLLDLALSLNDAHFEFHFIGEYGNFCDSHSAKNIIYHGALFDEVEISKVMLDMDVFVYPGTVGLSLIHSFCYGVPAILHSNKNHHNPEYGVFLDGINGWSFEEDCAQSLGQLLIHLHANPVLVKEAKNHLTCFIDDQSSKKMAERFESCIEKCVAQ